MRITAVTVRNYRIHRLRKVDLDPSRNVIGGCNETGKSTLVEAIHRALFLKSKGTGEFWKVMVPRGQAGHPEVEVCFECSGRHYRIAKRFSGTTGSSVLTDPGGAEHRGEEAEARLAELLGVVARGGRVTEETLMQQWAHLWVWQGRAGDNPCDHAGSQRDSLIARLQAQGGGAAMQSQLDTRLANSFAEQCKQIFGQRGEPKKGSDLHRVQQETKAAEANLRTAQILCAKLQDAMDEYRTAERTIQDQQSALVKLRSERSKVQTGLRQLAELRNDEQRLGTAARIAFEEHDSFASIDREIRTKAQELERLSQELQPKNAAIEQAKQREQACIRQESEAEAAHEQAARLVRSVRQHHDLARAYVTLLDKTRQSEQQKQKAVEVRKLRDSLVEPEAALARLPAIDQHRLDRLQQLDRDLSLTVTTLEATAAGVEIVSSHLPVQVGQVQLAVGQSRIITEVTEVSIGSRIVLRVRPGGGNNLAEARKKRQDSAAQLQLELDSLGIASVDEAREIYKTRQELEAGVATTRARLSGLSAENIQQELAAAQQAVAEAEGEVERREELVPGFPAPTTLAEAQAALEQAEEQLMQAELGESRNRGHQDTVAELRQQASEDRAALESTLVDEQQEISRLEVEIGILVTTHGDDAHRSQRLARLRKDRDEKKNRLTEVRREIEDLQPELLQADDERLARAIDKASDEIQEAEKKKATAQGTLRSDGTADPQAELDQALAHLATCREEQTRIQRRANATRLLSDLFENERQALASRFAGPLAEKVTEYLRCVFGVNVQARVKLENSSFTGFDLVRPDPESGAFVFQELSGGAKEQVAAAFRLAMAEILAEAHDHSLPIVFDDAFAYSDPDRVGSVQRMLDLAARRGLQVIVLTCNPADYSGLGAKLIMLDAVRTPPTTPATVPAGTADAFS